MVQNESNEKSNKNSITILIFSILEFFTTNDEEILENNIVPKLVENPNQLKELNRNKK